MQVHDNEVVARGKNLRISHKHAREVGKFIDGESVSDARQKLEGVITKDIAVPYKRYNQEQGHRKGNMDNGRFPVKTAEAILKLLNSAEQNAVYEGMDEERLYVSGFMANQGTRFYTPKRHRGRQRKSAHVDLKVGER